MLKAPPSWAICSSSSTDWFLINEAKVIRNLSKELGLVRYKELINKHIITNKDDYDKRYENALVASGLEIDLSNRSIRKSWILRHLIFIAMFLFMVAVAREQNLKGRRLIIVEKISSMVKHHCIVFRQAFYDLDLSVDSIRLKDSMANLFNMENLNESKINSQNPTLTTEELTALETVENKISAKFDLEIINDINETDKSISLKSDDILKRLKSESNLLSDPISKEESSIKSRKGDEANQDKTVFQRKEEETRQNAENDVSTVVESELVNKEPNNNEGSHDIKPSVYKKAESVTDEIKMNNVIRNSSLRIDDLSPMQNRKKPKLLKYLQKVGGAVKKLLVHEAEIILL